MRFARLLALVLLFVAAPSMGSASQQRGVLRIGSDISYAPVEFYGADRRLEGLDYDLAQAMASKMGIRVSFSNHDFNDLANALNRGTFDVVMSAYNDTRDREKRVDFLDYFLAGSGILVPRGNPNHIFNLEGLCGLTVDLQKGTSQENAIRAASNRCTQVGLKPIVVLGFATDSEALRALTSRRSVAHISDYPVVAYLARTLDSGKAYEVAGRQFGVVPYGIGVAKNNPQLMRSLQTALKAIIADGTYDALLKKWGLEQGAMRAASINAGRLY